MICFVRMKISLYCSTGSTPMMGLQDKMAEKLLFADSLTSRSIYINNSMLLSNIHHFRKKPLGTFCFITCKVPNPATRKISDPRDNRRKKSSSGKTKCPKSEMKKYCG